MKETMVRVGKNTINKLKMIKEVEGSKESFGSIIDRLVNKELSKNYVVAKGDYVGSGNVVRLGNGAIAVVDRVTLDKVVFTDGGYILNSAGIDSGLELVADSVSSFDNRVRYE